MNKRENLLNLLNPNQPSAYVPAAFFIHFDPEFHGGQPAVDKHMAFFRYTDMDLVKIQYEQKFPHQPQITQPKDWGKMPLFKKDFYQPLLQAVKGLVAAAKDEAVVIVTLYSPFMCAGHASNGLLVEHLQQEPEQVKQGLEIVTDSLLGFVRECIKLGVDGFYASTQGGEQERFTNKELFLNYVKPFDLALMEEMNHACPFNILHVCDYKFGYDDLTPFLDYPGHIVNVNQQVGATTLAGQEVSEMFGRPFMGGLDRKGVIATGAEDEIVQGVNRALDAAPDKFFLAADCTLPDDVSWDNIKTAIAAAHSHGKR